MDSVLFSKLKCEQNDMATLRVSKPKNTILLRKVALQFGTHPRIKQTRYKLPPSLHGPKKLFPLYFFVNTTLRAINQTKVTATKDDMKFATPTLRLNKKTIANIRQKSIGHPHPEITANLKNDRLKELSLCNNRFPLFFKQLQPIFFHKSEWNSKKDPDRNHNNICPINRWR